MPKVMLICGKICSGKTTFSKELRRLNGAVLLSSDELMSALFHPNENLYHDELIKSVQKYLANKSVELVKSGTNVVLDWGFWTKNDRKAITDFFHQNKIETEWYYLNIPKDRWNENILKRNNDVQGGKTTDYYVDEGLLNKVNSIFEPPTENEMDNWINL